MNIYLCFTFAEASVFDVILQPWAVLQPQGQEPELALGRIILTYF